MRTAPFCFVLLWAAAGVYAAGPSGAREEAGSSAADYDYFERKIRPLLAKRCYECHSEKSKQLRGDLRLDSREAVLAGGDSGPAVAPGKPEESLLISAVRYGPDGFQMPPAGKLPATEIAELTAWVKRGAPFPPTRGEAAVRKKGIDFATGKKFWSFQPLRMAALPEVKNQAGVRNSIDSFVLATLEQRGLRPAAPADRRTLMRRLSFDLTGLPPAPEDMADFVNDRAPDAYERLVDRLLASPRYGERWGRFWLDRARYTDATAKWLDSTARAHLYRDWVVRAFNEDLPYHDFVKLQLAADQMPGVKPADLAALGFLGLSPTYWKELKLPMEIIKVIVADEWEERVDVVSRTFLGLTAACARCHDHKFDPISNEDYYALAGVFASTRFAERPLIPQEDYRPVEKAKAEVAKLSNQMDALKKQKPPKKETAAEVRRLQAEIAAIKQRTPHYDAPLANVVSDASLYVLRQGKSPQSGTRLEYRPQPRDLNLFVRGNPNNLGPVVPRRFLRVLSRGEPRPFSKGSGRLELAEAIVDDAGPLAGRVIVNRIWQKYFGRGLVDTPSNFGAQGARPSHPLLLDHLTHEFMEYGGSLKWLHRRIVLSATYRQSSRYNERNFQLDADNRLLWRMNRRRLEIEQWRDAMLAASGRLDASIGGPAHSLKDAGNVRRTLYGTVHRREMNAMLRLFDFPDPTAHSPRRIDTTSPLQGLYQLNSPAVAAAAAALAQRVQRERPSDAAGQVRRAYELLFARPPAARELALALSFLSGSGDSSGGRWSQLAQVLLGCNEMMFLD